MKLNKYRINFKTLDVLRGVAALYVVINHCRGHLKLGGSQLAEMMPISDWSVFTKIEYALLSLTNLGTEFVILFFILSGFSIRHSLSGEKGSLKKFYFRRFVRLYLPFVLALIWAYLIFQLLIVTNSPYVKGEISVFDSLTSAVQNVLYIPNGFLIPQFWSLSHEVIFYLLAPLIMYSLKFQKYYVIVSFLLFILGLFLGKDIVNTNILSKFFLHYNIYFSVGVLTYHYQCLLKKIKILNSKYVFYILIFLVYPALVLSKSKMGGDNTMIYLFTTIASVILIINTLIKETFSKFFYKLGEMSYTLYITHFASVYLFVIILMNFNIIDQRNTDLWYVWVLGVIFSILVAIPFYVIGEKPTKKYLNYLRNKYI